MCVRLGEALDDYHFTVRAVIKELEKASQQQSIPRLSPSEVFSGNGEVLVAECAALWKQANQSVDTVRGGRVDRLMRKFQRQERNVSLSSLGSNELEIVAQRKSMPINPTINQIDKRQQLNTSSELRDGVDRLMLSPQGQDPDTFVSIRSSTGTIRMRPLSMVGTIHVGIESSIAKYPSNGTMKELPPTPQSSHTPNAWSDELRAAFDDLSIGNYGGSRSTIAKEDDLEEEDKKSGDGHMDAGEGQGEEFQSLLPNKLVHHSKTLPLPSSKLGNSRRDRLLRLRRESLICSGRSQGPRHWKTMKVPKFNGDSILPCDTGQTKEELRTQGSRRWNSIRRPSLNGISGLQHRNQPEQEGRKMQGSRRWHSLRKLKLNGLAGLGRERDECDTPEHVPLKAAAVLGLKTKSAQRTPLKRG